jgi:hypothetical protein
MRVLIVEDEPYLAEAALRETTMTHRHGARPRLPNRHRHGHTHPGGTHE